MKLPQNEVTVQSNMVFDEVVKVGIADDDEALALVIERLIETYKNPYRAALREYTSNAYDEHIEAGVTRPVEVTLPSELSPELSVRDFGRGLTREELKGYGTIGKSTKRDSNDTTGGFGMGSKCALAAAPTFTVTSVKDGVRNTVVVARDENNVPHMNFLAESKTEDENGTTVSIPISDVAKFGDLKNFWLGWKRGSILVDGEEPKESIYDTDKFRELRGGIGWYDLRGVTSGRDDIRVLINQVYYELEYQDLGLSYNQWNILKYYIIKIDNGTVKIAPSRETLLFNATTNAVVQKRTDAVLTLSSRDAALNVEQATDIKTALTLLEKMRSNGFPTEGIKWGGSGIVLPGQTYKGNQVPDPEGTWAVPHRDYSVKAGWRVDKNWAWLSTKRIWMNSDARKFMIVHSAGPATSYGRYGNRKAHREAFGAGEYLTTIDPHHDFGWDIFITSTPLKKINRHYRDMANVIVPADEFNKVVKDIRAVAAKEARMLAEAQKSARKLRVIPSGERIEEMSAAEVKDDFDYVVILRNQEPGFAGRLRDAMTTKANYNRTWVLGARRLRNKFKVAWVLVGKNDDITDLYSVLPPVVTIDELAVKAIEETYTTATKYDLMALRDRDQYGYTPFRNLEDGDLKKIKNKETIKWAKSMRDYKDTGAAARSEYEWLANYFPTVKEALAKAKVSYEGKKLPESPMKRYPLLRHIDSYAKSPAADIVSYINLIEKSIKG